MPLAGGEFCGNATMSAATLFCIRRGLEKAAVSVCAVGSCCAIYETVVFIKKSKIFPHAEKGSVKGIFLSPAPMVYAAVMLALALLVNFSRI